MSFDISVITPSFNQAAFVERTVRSVLSQGVAGLEYLVVDGGSTDGTQDILARYSDRLRWISEPDEGQADALNKGIRATSGPIIGWLNSDDVYTQGALSYVLSYFDQHPGVEVIYGDANHIGLQDEVIEPYPVEDWDYARLMETCYLCQPAVFFRRSIVDRFGLLEKRWHYALDYEYWLRVGRRVEFVRVPRLLAGSRVHAATKTFGAPVMAHREYVQMFRTSFGRVPDRWIFNYAHALAQASGPDRTRPAGKARYIAQLLFLSTFHFLRWNGGVTATARQTMAEWVRGPLADAVKGIFRS